MTIRKRVLFLVGENGSGKSTFLEALAIACGLSPEGGSYNLHPPSRISPEVSGGDPEAPIRHLADAFRLTWNLHRQRDGFFLRAETFYDFMSHLDRSDRELEFGSRFIDSYGGVSLHNGSHGESFLTLFLNRFSGGGLYLLDEPESALSAHSQSQFIIATHSPILLAFPDAQIISFDGAKLREVKYRDTDAFNVTRRFLSDPESMIRDLLKD